MLRRIFALFLLSLALAGSAFAQGQPCCSVTVTSTRPNNTTSYTATDVVGTASATWTFNSIGPAGSEIAITTAILEIDIAAIPSGMTSFRLHLYTVDPASGLSDNAAWDLPSGDRVGYAGYIDLGSPADLGSTLFTQNHQMWFQVRLAPGSSNLYGYLVTAGGYAPAAVSEVYKIILRSAPVLSRP
jgi:hypothetical protein